MPQPASRNVRRLSAAVSLSLPWVISAAHAGGEAGPRTEAHATYLVSLRAPPMAEVYAAEKDRETPAARDRARLALAAIDRQQSAIRSLFPELGVREIGALRVTLDAIHVRADEPARRALAASPDVISITPVSRYRSLNGQATKFVGAQKLWDQPTLPVHGEGIRVGIIDGGIDYTHADFDGPGDPAVYAGIDPGSAPPTLFPSAKIAGGYDFVGDDYDSSGVDGSDLPTPDGNPLDCSVARGGEGHGTHVAGIVAGVGVTTDGHSYSGGYDESIDPKSFLIEPGAAPAAILYAIRVTSCKGTSDVIQEGVEYAADPNGDGDPSDHLDVVNLSVGATFSAPTSPEIAQMANLVATGAIVVASGGNAGDSFYAASASPAGQPGVIAVAASVDDRRTGYTLTVTAGAPATSNEQLPLLDVVGYGLPQSVSGRVVTADPVDGCAPLKNASQAKGAIVLVNPDTATCAYADEVNNAADAGALAVLLTPTDGDEELHTTDADSTTTPTAPIPGLLVPRGGAAFIGALGLSVTVSDDAFAFSEISDEITDFSARGPNLFDSVLKPDIAAPGLQITSAGAGLGTAAITYSGTSMASPLVAGAAVLLRQLEPTEPPARIKARLMNGALPSLVDRNGHPYAVSRIGAGRLRAVAAAAAPLLLSASEPIGAVSLSFGTIEASEKTNLTRSVTVQNLTAHALTVDLTSTATYPHPGFTLSFDHPTISVPAADASGPGLAMVNVEVAVDPAAFTALGVDAATDAFQAGSARAALREAGGSLVATPHGASAVAIPYYAVLQQSGQRKAHPTTLCSDAAGTVTIPFAGPVSPDAPLTMVYELVGERASPPLLGPEAAPSTLRAVGITTDHPIYAADAIVYFGFAVAGEFSVPANITPYVQLDWDRDGVTDASLYVVAQSNGDGYDNVYFGRINDGSSTTGEFVLGNLLPDTANVGVLATDVFDLSFKLSDIGIQDNPVFDYRIVSLPPDATEPVLQYPADGSFLTYDASKPRVTALNPAAPGGFALPVFTDGPIVATTDGSAPTLLLLHHGNAAGKRFETVKLEGPCAAPGGQGGAGGSSGGSSGGGAGGASTAASGGALSGGSPAIAGSGGSAGRTSIVAGSGGAVRGGAAGASEAAGATSADAAPAKSDGGCGCREARTDDHPHRAATALFGFAVALAARRRRPRHQR